MTVSIVEKLNLLSAEMESLLDFIAADEILAQDFQNYVEENKISIESQAQLNIHLVEYLLDGYMQNGMRVLDYYSSKGAAKNNEVLEALKNSVTSVFEVKRVLKNAFETYSLTAEKDFCLIPLVKMTNLRGISRGNYFCARVIEWREEFYLLEIYEIISALNFYKAGLEALKCLITNPKCVAFKNDEKKTKLKNSLLEMRKTFEEKFASFDKKNIITTNKLADSLLNAINNEEEVLKYIKTPESYKFFNIKEFENDNDFLKNAISGFSNHNCTYDVGLFFDDLEGLYVIPFLGTFYKIFSIDGIEGEAECIREFLKSDKVPEGVIKEVMTLKNFTQKVNSALGTNFGDSNEIIEKFKPVQNDKYSPMVVLYNSKIFSDIMGYSEANQNKQEFQGVGRNDPCPCGSGKKFKNCCMK